MAGAAALLLVLGALTLGGAGLLCRASAARGDLGGGRRRRADARRDRPVPQPPRASTNPKCCRCPRRPTAAVPGDGAQGRMVCTLVPERSRVTVTATDKVDLDLGE
jgi:hypothetical protein